MKGLIVFCFAFVFMCVFTMRVECINAGLKDEDYARDYKRIQVNSFLFWFSTCTVLVNERTNAKMNQK